PSSNEIKPESKLPPIFEGKDDFISLNAAMAAAHFEINPSLQNRSDLVYALSKLVAHRCMRTLHHTLVYSNPPQDKDCQDAIFYTLSLDPSNPEAICAKDGIDSPSCRNAFREQETVIRMPYKVDPNLLRKFESDIRIKEGEQAAAISKAKDQLQAALSIIQNEATEAKKKPSSDLMNAFTTLLDIHCLPILIVPNPEYEKLQQEQNKALSQDSQDPASSNTKRNDLPTFNQMLSQLINTPSKSTPIPRLRSRSRVISENCHYYIQQSLEYIPDFPRAICHRDGFYSPNCIIALRKQKISDAKASKTPISNVLGGLEPF
ncbi:MAG: hypothetical protein GYA55_06940, partial [SAR324 cluster bacterium]|nr:hypothetical protein [SAR324 cluster bacterium]